MPEVSPPVVSAAIKPENSEKLSTPRKTPMEKVRTTLSLLLLAECIVFPM